jgi:uncharacterized Zn finger protein
VTGGWVPRWEALLASFGWGDDGDTASARRKRRVTELRSGPGGVEGKVRLSDAESHSPRVSFLPLPAKVLDAAIRTMAGKARFAASLLSGRIPLDVESAFAGTGRTLLPASPQEIRLECTCRSPEEVCPHVRVLLALLGERFDHDPFLLFELRGIEREPLLARLKRYRSSPRVRQAPEERPVARSIPTEPLPEVRPDAFFRPTAPLGPRRSLVSMPESGETLLARLGPPPFTDPQAQELLLDLHRAVGLGARERLSEWEWRRIGRRSPA